MLAQGFSPAPGIPADFNVDDIIAKLLEVRGCRPGKLVNLTEGEITGYFESHCSRCEIYWHC